VQYLHIDHCVEVKQKMTKKKSKYQLRFTLNSEEMALDIEPGISALELIRDVLDLKGTKEGCGIGECGACTIVVDGRAVNACLMFAAQLDGRNVLTVEGLNREEELHPIQQSFAEKHAVQCGFCTPGILMSTQALLAENQRLKRDEIIKAVAGNLCRCTGYQSIIAGIEDAAVRCRQGRKREEK
jgi:aerobic-type carbon monoxide dehydrogenase small subunit (CoxS/CutS family)